MIKSSRLPYWDNRAPLLLDFEDCLLNLRTLLF